MRLLTFAEVVSTIEPGRYLRVFVDGKLKGGAYAGDAGRASSYWYKQYSDQPCTLRESTDGSSIYINTGRASR